MTLPLHLDDEENFLEGSHKVNTLQPKNPSKTRPSSEEEVVVEPASDKEAQAALSWVFSHYKHTIDKLK